MMMATINQVFSIPAIIGKSNWIRTWFGRKNLGLSIALELVNKFLHRNGVRW